MGNERGRGGSGTHGEAPGGVIWSQHHRTLFCKLKYVSPQDTSLSYSLHILSKGYPLPTFPSKNPLPRASSLLPISP